MEGGNAVDADSIGGHTMRRQRRNGILASSIASTRGLAVHSGLTKQRFHRESLDK